MEEKLLIGTKAMEQAMSQEKEFSKVRKELEDKKNRELKLAEDLAKKGRRKYFDGEKVYFPTR